MKRERIIPGKYTYKGYMIELHDDPSGTALSRSKRKWNVTKLESRFTILFSGSTLKEATEWIDWRK